MVKKPKLVFVNRHSRRAAGSSLMRVTQLAGHMRQFHGGSYDVHHTVVSRSGRALTRAWLTTRYPDAIFLFSKWAAVGWTSEDFEWIRKRARAVLVDYVDKPIEEMVLHGVDGHIAASHTGADLLKAEQASKAAAGGKTSGAIHVVLHNYDVAIDQIRRNAPTDRLAMAYLGTREVMQSVPEIDQGLTFLDAGSTQAFRKNVGRLGAFNCHYGVRNPRGKGEKLRANPFTKGATAAACDAIIFTDRMTEDAVVQLGDDYPYLLTDNSAGAIKEGLAFLRESFDGPEWHMAMDHMRQLKDRVSHHSIANQLDRAIRAHM